MLSQGAIDRLLHMTGVDRTPRQDRNYYQCGTEGEDDRCMRELQAAGLVQLVMFRVSWLGGGNLWRAGYIGLRVAEHLAAGGTLSEVARIIPSGHQ